MTIKTVAVCSQCETERREANHWFVYMRREDALEFYHWEWLGRHASKAVPAGSELGHLCGQQCAHKLLDQFLNEKGSS